MLFRSITPLAMPCLLVFIALFAPETIALFVAMLLGVLVDLSPGYGELDGGAHLIGPNALGYLVTTLLVLKIRNVVFRRRVFTIAVLTAAAVIVTGATEALVLLVRGILPWTPVLKGGEFSDLIKLFDVLIELLISLINRYTSCLIPLYFVFKSPITCPFKACFK